MTTRIKLDPFLLSIIGLTLAIFVLNIIWTLIEKRPPHWDMGRHLLTGLNYKTAADSGAWQHLLIDYYYYPPLLYIASLPFLYLFGLTIPAAVATNMVFLLIFSISIYLIGRMVSGRMVGLTAAVLALGLPMIISQAKEFQVDLPLTAMVTAGLYLLMASDYFGRRWYSFGFGLVAGLGLLTKWTYPLALALPVAIGVSGALVLSRREHNYRRLANILLVVCVALALAGPWYSHNRHALKVDIVQNGTAAGVSEGDPAIGSMASNFYYLKNLANNQLYLLPLGLLLVGLGYTVISSDRRRKLIMPVALVIGSYIAFSLLRNKDPRYTLPIMSGVAVIAVYWIEGLRRRQWQHLVAGTICLYSGLIYGAVSFGLPRLHDVAVGPIVAFAQHGYIIGHPTNENWYQEDIFQYIDSHSDHAPAARVVDWGARETIWFNGWGARYYAVKYGMPVVDDPATARFIIMRGDAPAVGALKTYRLPDASYASIMKSP